MQTPGTFPHILYTSIWCTYSSCIYTMYVFTFKAVLNSCKNKLYLMLIFEKTSKLTNPSFMFHCELNI